MIRVCVFAILVCAARAGLIGLDGHGLIGAPVAVAAPIAVAHAPVAVAHGAESWQNNNLLALNPTPIITKVAAPVPVVTKVVSAPVLTKVAVASPWAGAAPWGGVSPWGK